jgi:hypothetical protein
MRGRKLLCLLTAAVFALSVPIRIQASAQTGQIELKAENEMSGDTLMGIKLTWDYSGAGYYNIFRQEADRNGKYIRSESYYRVYVTDGLFVDPFLKEEKTYRYRIDVLDDKNNVIAASSYDDPDATITTPMLSPGAAEPTKRDSFIEIKFSSSMDRFDITKKINGGEQTTLEYSFDDDAPYPNADNGVRAVYEVCFFPIEPILSHISEIPGGAYIEAAETVNGMTTYSYGLRGNSLEVKIDSSGNVHSAVPNISNSVLGPPTLSFKDHIQFRYGRVYISAKGFNELFGLAKMEWVVVDGACSCHFLFGFD